MNKFLSSLAQRIANLSPEKRALLEQKLLQQHAAKQSAHTISRRQTASPCPLSFAQQRLWFLDQLEPHSSVYNLPKAIRLRGALDVAALQQTLNAIVARHEVLRTTFATVAGAPVQVIGDSRPVELSILDLRQVPQAVREADMYRQLREAAQRPFDLSRDLMLRATLLQLDAAEYALLLTKHHIASDGWSGGVLFRELAAFYSAYITGEPVNLPELPIQYADYALWQRQWLQGEVLENQLAYWQQQLIGSPAALELPTDRPRPTVQSYRGAIERFTFPAGLTDSLKIFSRQAGVTLYMMLLAALQTLLHRYTGQQDIVVGSPIAGRNRVETEALIGFFVNTLVLRTNFSGHPTFHELLHRVQEVAMGAYAHQELPFEKLVEELHPERSLSYSLLFQIMFAFQNVPRLPLALPGLTLSPLDLEGVTAKFDMTLSMWEEAGGLSGTAEYSTDLFDRSTISRMLGHFQTLLQEVVAHPEQRLADLALLSVAERQQLLVDWNATDTPAPQTVGLHQLFEAQVDRAPNAVALVAANGQLTYRELNQRANQLAHYLRMLGVGPEVLVGICVEPGLEMVVGLLGILKAGGAYVPLDPAYPQVRLAFMLQDTRLPVLLTEERFVPELPAHNAHVVCLDTHWDSIARQSEENPASTTTPESLAYVIYTSGSTGRPKGVLGLHRGAVNRFAWMWAAYPFGSEEVCCQKTSLNFVDAVWEIFGPLLQGVRLVIIPSAVVQDPRRLVQTLATSHVTRLVLVPSLLRSILDACEALHNPLPGVRLWISSGEPLTVELRQRFQECMPGSTLLNLYGSSEVAADVTWYDTSQMPTTLTSVPLGRPIANTQMYLLDTNQNPVPVGVPGELYAGGAGVARGYLYRPELTAEAFLPDPFSATPGSRLYKTGDLARYLPDGAIEFLGRADHQVKIRGFRIELGEIEAVLHQHPAIQTAIVSAREDTPGNQRLVAYLVAHQQPLPDSAVLRRFVQEKLPDYMVPSLFVGLDTLPLTPNGKIDRRALPTPEQQRSAPELAVQTSGDALEQLLTKVWEDVLDIRPIGPHDNFFALGGHSLLAVRLFAEIENVLGHELPLAMLFQAPTIEQLASALREAGYIVSQ